MIYELTDGARIQVHDQQGIYQLQFITFHNLLTAPMSPPNLDVSRYYSFTIFDALFYVLVIDVIYEGIKIVLLSIPDDKTPRRDGFTFFFL
jgi:hypothetical protein